MKPKPIQNKNKKYLCFGDSGNGKSSFINCFLSTENKLSTSDNGDSCTKKLNIVQAKHGELGDFSLIDSQGTNDTELLNPSSILEGILDFIITKKEELNEIDGILYFHDSNQTARFYAPNRLKLLNCIIKGVNLCENVILICTKYNDLKKAKKEQFKNFLSKYESMFNSICFWDSIDYLSDQFEQLRKSFNKVKGMKLLLSNDIYPRIVKKSEDLHENNKIKKTRKIAKNGQRKKYVKKQKFITETKKDWFDWSFTEHNSFSLSHNPFNFIMWPGYLAEMTYFEKKYFTPSYPSLSWNGKIENISIKKDSASRVNGFDTDSSTEGWVSCRIRFNGTMSNHAYICLRIDYVYSYRIEEDYYDEEIENYIYHVDEEYLEFQKNSSKEYLEDAKKWVLEEELEKLKSEKFRLN